MNYWPGFLSEAGLFLVSSYYSARLRANLVGHPNPSSYRATQTPLSQRGVPVAGHLGSAELSQFESASAWRTDSTASERTTTGHEHVSPETTSHVSVAVHVDPALTASAKGSVPQALTSKADTKADANMSQ